MTSWTDDEVGGTVWSDDESGAADGSLTGSEVDVDADKVRVIDATDNRPKLVTVEELVANTSVFTQSGTGATARTVQAKLREVHSLEDFGAVGDGVTADTSAIALAQTWVNGADGRAIRLLDGATYLCGAQISIHRSKWFCEGQATLKFTGLGASTDCVVIQGSAASSRAGLENIIVDANDTGRDAIVLAGGKSGANTADYPFLRGVYVNNAVRDGVHTEPYAANAWIENIRFDDVKVNQPGRHGFAFIHPDLSGIFINKGSYYDCEVRGAGQTTTGYDVYVESADTAGTGSINMHAWYNPELDYQGSATHGQHAVLFHMSGTASQFLGWNFFGATFEDASGSAGTYAEAIGITGSAVVSQLAVHAPCSISDYTKIVDTTLLDTGCFIAATSASGEGLLKFSTATTIQIGDVNLYRNAANRMKTDDAFEATNGHWMPSTARTSSSGAVTLGYGMNRTSLTENITAITFPTAVDGAVVEWDIRQGASGYTVAGWPANVSLPGGTFTMSATNLRVDKLAWRYNGGFSKWVIRVMEQDQS
jgi:hypothetical protein